MRTADARLWLTEDEPIPRQNWDRGELTHGLGLEGKVGAPLAW
jgi:hypothetical protein